MGYLVNSSVGVSPGMDMGAWRPPANNDPAIIPMPSNTKGNALGSSVSSPPPPLSTGIIRGSGDPTSGNWNAWANGELVMSTSNEPRAAWDPAFRLATNGSGIRRRGAGGREGLNSNQHQSGGPSNRNAENGRDRNVLPRGSGTGLRPLQPSHMNNFGMAVHSLPVDGFPMDIPPLPDFAYGNGPLGVPFEAPARYIPYLTGYHAGMPPYPVHLIPYGHIDGRQMLPPTPHCGFSWNLGRGSTEPGRKGRPPVGPQGFGSVSKPLAQARNRGQVVSEDARPSRDVDVRGMPDINGVIDQIAIGFPLREGAEGESPGDPGHTVLRAAGRKHYHPAASPNRSRWVMWVGNVPKNGEPRS
jgi:hypothetical protein